MREKQPSANTNMTDMSIPAITVAGYWQKYDGMVPPSNPPVPFYRQVKGLPKINLVKIGFNLNAYEKTRT